MPQGVRHGARERVGYRWGQALVVRSGTAHGVPDLLLVHPVLGVLAGDVQPTGASWAGPGDRLRPPKIQRRLRLIELGSEVAEQIDQETRAPAMRGVHELLVHPVQEAGRLSAGSGPEAACWSRRPESFRM